MSQTKCIHVFVHGTVQGVFYRKSTESFAVERDLSGWVRNRHDGRVEVMAMGTEPALIHLLNWLGNGPELARVVKLDIMWITTDMFEWPEGAEDQVFSVVQTV